MQPRTITADGEAGRQLASKQQGFHGFIPMAYQSAGRDRRAPLETRVEESQGLRCQNDVLPRPGRPAVAGRGDPSAGVTLGAFSRPTSSGVSTGRWVER